MLPYILPFAVYIAFSLIGGYFENGTYLMYPLKTVAVAVTLWINRRHYEELFTRISFKSLILSVLIGLLAFVVWVIPEGMYPVLGESEFNPFIFQETWIVYPLIIFRIVGAVLVVPIFEELFWRSFLIRWIIDQDFKTVAIGKFTWLSFVVTVILFGLEHNRWLVGLGAGALYNGLYYHQKSLWPCIIAHSVTNLILGIYVLQTGQWSFW